jgi:hypothetical protein
MQSSTRRELSSQCSACAGSFTWCA